MIVNFGDYKQRELSNKEKIKYRVQGDYEDFTCNGCGGTVTVYHNVKPNSCPCCNKTIVWE